MNLSDILQGYAAERLAQLPQRDTEPEMPQLLTPERPESNNKQNMMMLLGLLGQRGGGGGVGSTYTGGTGDFNATHEGSGTQGLTFGQSSQYTPLAQKLYNLVERKFPEVSMGGIQANRNIAGTNTPSEHAYGAAVDLMVGNNNLGDLIAKFLGRPRIADRFDYSNVLWEVPNHYNHLHVGWLY